MRSLCHALTGLWILLIPFQNSGLQATPISYLGASPAFIPLTVLMMLTAAGWCLNLRHVKMSKAAVSILFYALVVNVVYLIPNASRSHGTSLVAKTFNLSVLTLLILFPVFFVDYRDRRLGAYIQAAFCITIAGVLLCDILNLQSVAGNTMLNYFPNKNLRPRGFELEASTLAATTLSLGLLSVYFARRVSWKLIFLAVTISAVLYSGSRGGLLALMTVVALFVLFGMRSSRSLRAAVIAVWIIGCIGVTGWLVSSFRADIDTYTSSVTRAGLVITAVVTAAHNPFGVGFSGFLPAVDKYAPAAAELMEKAIGTSLSFEEMLSYVGAESDANISTKSFLFDFLTFYGWPFVLLFAWFNYTLLRRLKRAKSNVLLLTLGYACLAICTSVNPIGVYFISLIYGVALSEVRRKENPGSLA